jgi:hypothetical protein
MRWRRSEEGKTFGERGMVIMRPSAGIEIVEDSFKLLDQFKLLNTAPNR